MYFLMKTFAFLMTIGVAKRDACIKYAGISCRDQKDRLLRAPLQAVFLWANLFTDWHFMGKSQPVLKTQT